MHLGIKAHVTLFLVAIDWSEIWLPPTAGVYPGK